MENYTYFYCNSKNIEAKNGNCMLKQKKNEKKNGDFEKTKPTKV